MTAQSQIDFAAAKSELATIAQKSGALVSGVADADAFDAAPEVRRPADILPKAKSVFVIGGAQPRAGDWQSPNYQHMEVTTTSDRMQTLALKMARIIEDRFAYYTVCVPPGVDLGQQPFVSIAMAADLAGCGSKSLAGPVLHSEYGFMYYGTIITTMPLPRQSRWLSRRPHRGRALCRQAIRRRTLCDTGPELLGAGLPEGAGRDASGTGCRQTEDDVVLEHVQPNPAVDDLLQRQPGAVCGMHARLPCRPGAQNEKVRNYAEE